LNVYRDRFLWSGETSRKGRHAEIWSNSVRPAA
jgi:hypothetical protein